MVFVDQGTYPVDDRRIAVCELPNTNDDMLLIDLQLTLNVS